MPNNIINHNDSSKPTCRTLTGFRLRALHGAQSPQIVVIEGDFPTEEESRGQSVGRHSLGGDGGIRCFKCG